MVDNVIVLKPVKVMREKPEFLEYSISVEKYDSNLNKKKTYKGGIIQSTKDFLFLDEAVVWGFLYPFLDKYFDKDLDANQDCRCNHKGQFDDYDANFYTFETINKMLLELKDVSQLLKEEDFDNSKLDVLDYKKILMVLSDYEAEKEHFDNAKVIIQEHKDLVIDFYDCFINEMEKMMKNNPEYNLIDFDGP